MDDLKNIIVFSGCVDKAKCGDVVKMTEKIEKLILCRNIESRLDEIEHLDYPIRKAELQQQLKEMKKEKCQWCGSIIKISQRGNEYCTNICWEKEPYKTQREMAQIEHEAIMETRHSDWGDRQ